MQQKFVAHLKATMGCLHGDAVVKIVEFLYKGVFSKDDDDADIWFYLVDMYLDMLLVVKLCTIE